MDIKTVISLVIITLTYFVGTAQNTFVPDDNFEQALIDLGLDFGALDDYVPTANISAITDLDVNNLNISDLTGIEDFAALSTLNCDQNNLTSLDVTQNTNLTQLFCRNNQLTTLDTSQNTLLNILWVEENQLNSLDVSNNTQLISLITDDNPINNLDVTANTALTVLSCENNQLTNIDISNNLSLFYLSIGYNSLTTLNTSTNIDLQYLACGDNLITSLDLTQNTRLSTLFCARIPINDLNVTNNLVLQRLTFSQTQVSSLNVSNNPLLEQLWCSRNLITSLDVSNNLLLDSFFCDFNNITSLDLTRNSNLREFGAGNNNLCYLNIRNGNNSNIVNYNSNNNPNLSCIFVDNIAYSNANWTNIDAASNFVTSQAQCDAFGNTTPPVDTLNDFIGMSYTLPVINNGYYFTQPNGNGTSLNAGDIIANSQTIYIYNQVNCYSNESSFNVIITASDYYIPKFFTPNNDGSHDYWQVLDNSNAINTIKIYDRYGKLLKSLQPNAEGWNGTYRGRLLESNDYWYAITLNTGETIKGHFTLKR
ncbi:T9SS type B sorting domain-containing protein [Confluentibacter lentus]|uniref:T9SS type B sorting domain-containing protein n=1 Tax=Confluentibacter lentus TaxID=1699412 RepID=UPI000C294FA7|nr:T9SS type B sorting domain-containing protein [Confluentibacter lentus]